MATSWSDADDSRAIEMRNAGATDGEIAVAVGRSRNAVQTRLSRLRAGGVALATMMTGPWSEERVIAVINMIDDGQTLRSIARSLGIGEDGVRFNVELLRAEGRVPDPDDEDDQILVPDGDPLLAALRAEAARGRSA